MTRDGLRRARAERDAAAICLARAVIAGPQEATDEMVARFAAADCRVQALLWPDGISARLADLRDGGTA